MKRIGWFLAAVCLPFALHAEEYTGLRGIIRQHVEGGRVDEELASSTGWNSLRAFSWQMLLVDQQTGDTTPTSVKREFVTNQAFRLNIEAHTDLWIYVMNVGPNGKMVTLLPKAGEEHVFVKGGTKVAVPDDSFMFDAEPGVEQFRIVASPVKLEWIQPMALWKLESDVRLSPDEKRAARAESEFRHKSITGIQASQSKKQASAGELTTKSLPELIHLLEQNPDLRGRVKDVVLLPPASEVASEREDQHRHDAVMVSEDANSEESIVIDIKLKHK